jgi:hypothetical protein
MLAARFPGCDRIRTARKISALPSLLSLVLLGVSPIFAQGGGGGAGGAAGINLGNLTGNLPAGINAGNVATIIGNLPAGTNLGSFAGAIGGNGTVSSTPLVVTSTGLLAGDSGTASVVIPSQAAASIAGGTTDPNAIVTATTNTYLWSITGGTLTSDPTKATVTYTAATAGTATLSVAVTVVGSSPVTASANVTVVSPDTAGTITAPATIATNATSATATVPAAVSGDRTFRWTVSGDATIVGSATTATLTFKPGTPGVKDLTCAVRLQNLVTVNLHSFLVVTGSGPATVVTVVNGAGGGTYPGGSRVDLLADPPAPGQVFDKWTGDVSALGTGALATSLPHALITVPTAPITLTANYKPAATWTPTVIASFNPQSITNATTNTTTSVGTTLAYFVPANASGIVVLLHDTGGNVNEWFNSPEKAQLTRDLVAAGYGVAALNNLNRNSGAWEQATTLATNHDALNVAAALAQLVTAGATTATTPAFLLGDANGADAAASYAELLAATKPIKGVVLFDTAGSETLAVTSHVPQFFALSSNDDVIGTAGNTTARNNSQLLIGRGVTSAVTTSTVVPIYPNRFRAIGNGANAFTATDAASVFTALKTAALLDANSYLKAIPTSDALKAALPATYQARAADIATELNVAYAASELYSEADARVIAFLNTRVAGAAGPTPGRLANLSTLGKIYTATDSFTLGFNIAGPEKATLLIRGVGPALGSLFKIATALPAPRLEVYNSANTLLASNQGWDQAGATTTAQVTAASTAVGAFALPAGGGDSAVVLANLAPGAYTVTVKGVNGAVGDVLAEVYDVTKNSTRLTNLSTLASINNPGDQLVPGIVIQGANPRTLLIRAVGPGLTSVGLPASAVLGDPRVTVLSGSTTVATNNNWSQGGATGQAASLTAAFPAVGAFALTAGSADAALISALAAGNFTLQADSSPTAANAGGQQTTTVTTNQTGLVLVEVYEVP